MRRYEAERKAKEEYGNCRLRYKITSDAYSEESNRENLDKMVAALEAVGIWLNIDDDVLSLSIYPEGYVRTKERNAGRRKASAWNNENGNFKLYKYADIVLMMQTMTDQQIYEKIKMKSATYYRHKKALKESNYYASLDLNKLRDKEYLDSVSGNMRF